MSAPFQKMKKKCPLKCNEEFVKYKYIQQANGKIKRKKVYKRITKKIKCLTEEQIEEIDNSFLLFDRD